MVDICRFLLLILEICTNTRMIFLYFIRLYKAPNLEKFLYAVLHGFYRRTSGRVREVGVSHPEV